MKKGLFLVAIILVLVGCGDGNVQIQVDPNIQLEEDSILIAEYLLANGYDDYQTTESGVRFVILSEGPGESIDESDIVTFNYTGRLINDSIFDTTIKRVGDSIRNVPDIPDKYAAAFPSDRTYSSITITYSETGWTLPKQSNSEEGLIDGFVDGVSATFNKMNVSGRAMVIFPSSLGYGGENNLVLIPANSVLIFEFYPTKLTKQ